MMAEAARTRRGKGRPDDGLFDRELDHLPPEARWREWMNRAEATISAASEPIGRETLAGIVGKSCSIDLLIENIREELRGRPYGQALLWQIFRIEASTAVGTSC